jgi:DNA-binding transcriptional MerR regulator
MTDVKTFTISELAAEFDVTTRTIRFYEEKGMLAPARQGQARVYNHADRVRLELILRGKRIGMSLDESREIIDMYDPQSDNSEQYHFLIDKVDARSTQLRKQLQDIEELLQGLQDVRDRCIAALSQPEEA